MMNDEKMSKKITQKISHPSSSIRGGVLA